MFDQCQLHTLNPLAGAPGFDVPMLAFDTSTETLAIAVSGPNGALSLLAPGGAAASASLLPMVLQLLSQAGLRLQDLKTVAFGNGPGAFTGLRTACAVAQGLGLGLGIPVLPIDSLLIVAEDARLQLQTATQGDGEAGHRTVAVAMDARMNEVYAGCYRWQALHAGAAGVQPQAAHWQVLQPPQLFNLVALAQAWAGLPAAAVVAGSALAAWGDELPAPPGAVRLPGEANRAAALLRLAGRAWADGRGLDAALALPLYGRDKVAQTTLERQQARDAKAVAAAALTGAVEGP